MNECVLPIHDADRIWICPIVCLSTTHPIRTALGLNTGLSSGAPAIACLSHGTTRLLLISSLSFEYYNPRTVHLLLFCIMTNNAQRISLQRFFIQYILLHYSTFPRHPQAVPHLCLAELHRFLNCSSLNYNFIKLLNKVNSRHSDRNISLFPSSSG